MKKTVLLSIYIAVILIVLPDNARPESKMDNDKITVAVRRLNESEYRNTIADVFGPEIKINARFEPEKREEGLLAIGNGLLALTSSGFEQYFGLANEISEQVFENQDREKLAGCKAIKREEFEEHCARKFVSHYGELLFRRPLTRLEVNSRVELAAAGTEKSKDFDKGLKLALRSLLVAPEFLFRIEMAELDPSSVGEYRLDAYTKAARLSFLFWNTTPDELLLDSARSGAIHTTSGLQHQLSRLAESDRLKEGVRAFFEDMFQLEGFENMVKDPSIYPKFNQSVATSAKEQALKTLITLLVEENYDYREIFTSNQTYINRPLAAVYKVPFASTEDWMRFTFDEDSERAGILTQVAFLSQHAHAGSSSPTRRGVKLHEIFMCEPTPDPPADVDFSSVRDSVKGTVRGRLLDHMENTGCTACHRRSDPPGLALEHFDGIGQLRKYENGELIDVSADFNGHQFIGAKGLAEYLQKDQRVPACLVRNVYAYGTARAPDFWDEDYLNEQTDKFSNQGYRVAELMKQIASTSEFFTAHVPEAIAIKP